MSDPAPPKDNTRPSISTEINCSSVQSTSNTSSGHVLEIRIAVLGASNSGRQTLISRYCTSHFSSYLPDPTDQLSRVERDVNGQRCVVQFVKGHSHWSIEPKMLKMLKVATKDADCLFLVYDIGNRDGFNTLRRVWENLREAGLLSKGGDGRVPVVVVVAAKIDTTDTEWKVGLEEGKDLAASFGGSFAAVSARSNVNVDDAVARAVESALVFKNRTHKEPPNGPLTFLRKILNRS